MAKRKAKQVIFRRIRGRIVPIVSGTPAPGLTPSIRQVRKLKKLGRETAQRLKGKSFPSAANKRDIFRVKQNNVIIRDRSFAQAKLAGKETDTRIKKLIRLVRGRKK